MNLFKLNKIVKLSSVYIFILYRVNYTMHNLGFSRYNQSMIAYKTFN